MISSEYKRQNKIIKESYKYMKIDFLHSAIIDGIYYKCIIDDNKKVILKYSILNGSINGMKIF